MRIHNILIFLIFLSSSLGCTKSKRSPHDAAYKKNLSALGPLVTSDDKLAPINISSDGNISVGSTTSTFIEALSPTLAIYQKPDRQLAVSIVNNELWENWLSVETLEDSAPHVTNPGDRNQWHSAIATILSKSNAPDYPTSRLGMTAPPASIQDSAQAISDFLSLAAPGELTSYFIDRNTQIGVSAKTPNAINVAAKQISFNYAKIDSSGKIIGSTVYNGIVIGVLNQTDCVVQDTTKYYIYTFVDGQLFRSRTGLPVKNGKPTTVQHLKPLFNVEAPSAISFS